MLNGVEILGMDEIDAILTELLPAESKKLARNFARGIAVEARKEVRNRLTRHRSGALKKSIRVKMRRSRIPGQYTADVIADQRKGAKYPGFHWRFVEYGTSFSSRKGNKRAHAATRAFPFVQPARDAMMERKDEIAGRTFVNKLKAQIQRAQNVNRGRN